MLLINDKVNNVNGNDGFLFANEMNSIKNELSNVIKYRNVMNENDDSQLLKSIVAESKILFYEDIGIKNKIELFRNNEVAFKLADAQVFLFSPKFINDDITTVKINNNVEIRVLLNGNEVPVGFLNPNVTYMLVYNAIDDVFNIRNLTIGNTSDFIFSSMHNESTFTKVEAVEKGVELYDNAVVYIDQNTGKYELAIIENPRTQKQNALGIFKVIDTKEYVFFDGIVPGFIPTLKSGLKYYLSNSVAGAITDGVVDKTVCIGRYIKNGKFILDINGDVSIDVGAPAFKVFNTTLVDTQNKEGVSLADINKLFTVMFDKLTYNTLATRLIMYANIDGFVFKLEFSPEYLNKELNVQYGDKRYVGFFKEDNVASNSINLYEFGVTPTDIVKPIISSTAKTFNTMVGTPLVMENVTATDSNDGKINVVQTGTVDFNSSGTYSVTYTATDTAGNSTSITHTYIVEALPTITTYDTSFKHPYSKEGIGFTEPTNTLTLMFNKLPYDISFPPDTMFIKVNGVIAKILYATEYANKIFEVDNAGIRYIGTFSKNESYTAPTVLNAK